MRSRSIKSLLILILGLAIASVVFVAPRLQLPAPTGPYPVGRTVLHWEDRSRPEVLTEDTTDFRQLSATLWYPAEPGPGAGGAYYPGLAGVADALVESGEVSRWQVLGLRFMRSGVALDAESAAGAGPYPVVILSPGNGTNIEFYSSLAGEIASHGYIVVGLNHPHDVAAVPLKDGTVAPYDKGQWTLKPGAHQVYTAERIEVRTADVLFALAQLEALQSMPGGQFEGLFDLDALAVAGHSLGGITASEACKAEPRFQACVNFDGLQQGGPFSAEATAIPPSQPFLFLTKESELHPELIERFRSTSESYWVVVHGAPHNSFTDSALLESMILPFSDGSDRVMTSIQEYTLAFLGHTLRGEPSALLSSSEHREGSTVHAFKSN